MTKEQQRANVLAAVNASPAPRSATKIAEQYQSKAEAQQETQRWVSNALVWLWRHAEIKRYKLNVSRCVYATRTAVPPEDHIESIFEPRPSMTIATRSRLLVEVPVALRGKQAQTTADVCLCHPWAHETHVNEVLRSLGGRGIVSIDKTSPGRHTYELTVQPERTGLDELLEPPKTTAPAEPEYRGARLELPEVPPEPEPKPAPTEPKGTQQIFLVPVTEMVPCESLEEAKELAAGAYEDDGTKMCIVVKTKKVITYATTTVVSLATVWPKIER